MEVSGEVSDTDSGIILHSGSDSPTTHTKDVTTHTRAMKLKHQALKDQLEKCILELKTLCIREAELTGQLSNDYPLQPGEKPPQIHRRIGAAFKINDQNIPDSKDSEQSLLDAELALQKKIYEAACKLYKEDHLSKAVRRSRLQQCKIEEKKLKKLQETAFELQLERGRSSPLPAFNITQDLGTSDDSSLSDSVGQDEEVSSQSSQPSLGLHYPGESDPPLPSRTSPHSSADGSYVSHSVTPRSQPLNSCLSPSPSLYSNMSFNSSPVYDPPPIQHSPWSESSLDQPYQKSKKFPSNVSSPAKSDILPPLESCTLQTSLPQQLSHLSVGRSLSNSMPSTPDMRVHRQLSLRLSSTESPVHKDRGHTRGPRRRLTEYKILLPETHSPTLSYINHASSEDSNSEKSFSSYSSAPCQDFPCNVPQQYQTGFPHPSLEGSYRHQALPPSGFHHNPRYLLSPNGQRTYYQEEMVYLRDLDMAQSRFPPQTPNRYDYCYVDAAVPHQRAQRLLPPDIRVTPPAQMDHAHYHPNGLPRQVVNEQLKSWHRRSQFRAPRSRSLDRQGAVRVKNTPAKESSYYTKYHEQGIQRETFQSAAEDAQQPWLLDNGTHYMSQV